MRRNQRIEPFVLHHRRYDGWFEHHEAAYVSELLAVRALLPWEGRGLEIGVGTGRFAAPLGVQFGIDPAAEMLGYARARGVCVAAARAEALPFADASFDYALVVTTICFVDDAAMLREAAGEHRVPKSHLGSDDIETPRANARCRADPRGNRPRRVSRGARPARGLTLR